MKAKIERAIRPNESLIDADTGHSVSDLFNTERPIRLQGKSIPLVAVSEEDLFPLRKVLRKKYGTEQIAELTQILRTPNDAVTDLMLKQGDDHIIYYYTRMLEKERYDTWEQQDLRRRASLGRWVYRGKLVCVDGWETGTVEEIQTVVIHEVLRHEDKHGQLKREIDLMLRAEQLMKPEDRVAIPEEVRMYVWRRDQGKCVNCGSNERIEYDHIIPISKGGSNTDRNIQILCERCNRLKSNKV